MGVLYFEDYLLGLLREEIEEDGFAESLVAQVFVDGEVFDVDEVVEGPIGDPKGGRSSSGKADSNRSLAKCGWSDCERSVNWIIFLNA